MDYLKKVRKQSVFSLVLIALLSSFALAACNGTAQIDVNFDATQGVGNIVITGDQSEPAQTDTSGELTTSQVLLFGIIAALLLGTVAIVISVARRPR